MVMALATGHGSPVTVVMAADERRYTPINTNPYSNTWNPELKIRNQEKMISKRAHL
jgi:hypothetical protein